MFEMMLIMLEMMLIMFVMMMMVMVMVMVMIGKRKMVITMPMVLERLMETVVVIE